MSVTIYWRPVKEAKAYFKGGTSSSYETLREVFPSQHLTEANVPQLRAMAKAAKDPFYDEVADRVEKVGALEFFGEY